MGTSVNSSPMSLPSLRAACLEDYLRVFWSSKDWLDSVQYTQGGRGHWDVYYTSPQSFMIVDLLA